jgi:hypothetical protein
MHLAKGLIWSTVLCVAAVAQGAPPVSMSEKEAKQTLAAMRLSGQVGGSFDFRVTSTNKSYNFKLRATWITPKVAVAAGRLLELTKGMNPTDTGEVVKAAAEPNSWLLLVELDPREGSGVIPSGWFAKFGPAGNETLRAVGRPIRLEGVWKSLVSAFPRDYSYDVFLLEFPRTVDGAPLLRASDPEAELQVRIESKQGRVHWKLPPDLFAENR